MQINLIFLQDDNFDNELWKKIDWVKDLDKYEKILPKNIQINTGSFCKISFIEKLFENFDPSITSFDYIKCNVDNYLENFILLSNIGKNVEIFSIENKSN
jgi:hypothetical protein